ncbi:hypothetical protein TREAZ_0271 [Leadbettera azotonutricia ZAS-9]|uniref:Uncharacterized protein n=1 Tax=Leadbettera azotonutricia (strain ATCC BAA-888 / DSM 13862 / ZAS-9) TaxID=545695 RepID=F5YE56_LEAAZ|nr:hypothetical protein TREAZ_0271 [Leadbettera azotonutricia ZAS-9]
MTVTIEGAIPCVYKYIVFLLTGKHKPLFTGNLSIEILFREYSKHFKSSS